MASEGLLKKYKFDMEKAEERHSAQVATGFPNPYCREKLIFEASNFYIEQLYYWIHDHIQYDHGYTDAEKITDVFAASEQSAFFGVSEQRLGMQQDKVAQYLKGISDMVKALFQIVRELRIIDERLEYYRDTYKRGKAAVASEITLKGIWIDQVEGGVKNAGSVYGLAQTVGFSVLPDLFFRLKVDDQGMDEAVGKPEWDTRLTGVLDAVDKDIDRIEFNDKVKEVLKRKLVQYYTWKGRTFIELRNRRNFTIKYLRQHYDTIKLYMGWVKPYLRNIRRLQMDQSKLSRAELVSAFEGSMVEIEVLHVKKGSEKAFMPCVLTHFLFITKPAMTYQAEGYQRGPGHVGKMEMTLRGYSWTLNQIENYKRMKEEEDLELLSSINESIKQALDALGSDLRAYLKESGEEFPEMEEKEGKIKTNYLEPFTSVFGGFKELFGSLFAGVNLSGFLVPKKKDKETLASDNDAAKQNIRYVVYQTFKNFKKAHKMISW